jgi:hypothetical protein
MQTPLSDTSWTHPTYETRVRGAIFLWGSGGILANLKFDKPLLLSIRNDPFGESIALATVVAGGAQTTIGTLNPGQCVTLPLQNMIGVVASCAAESTVHCFIH